MSPMRSTTSVASGSSPHSGGINEAVGALSASVNKAHDRDQRRHRRDWLRKPTRRRIRAASRSPRSVSVPERTSRHSQPGHPPGPYQNGSVGIDAEALIDGIGAAVAVPAPFTLTETPGRSSPSAARARERSSTGSCTWSGSLANGAQETLEYTATRNEPPLDLFSVTEETVSSSELTVGGGTVAPAYEDDRRPAL